MKTFKEELEKYISEWSVEAGKSIEEKAKVEGWDNFDFISAINFMLGDMNGDINKMVEKNQERVLKEIDAHIGRLSSKDSYKNGYNKCLKDRGFTSENDQRLYL